MNRQHLSDTIYVKHTLCVILLFLITASNAQGNLYGVVKDVKTMEEIPFAHVVSSQHGTVANSNGKFMIPYTAGDSIYITHVNYGQLIFASRSVLKDTIELFLHANHVLLNEITVYHLPSEEAFKNRVRATIIQPTELEQNAIQNMDNVKKLALSVYIPTMNSMDNFKFYVQTPHSVSILSSNSSKGIIKAVQNITKYPKLFDSSRQTVKPVPSDKLWKYYKLPSANKE